MQKRQIAGSFFNVLTVDQQAFLYTVTLVSKNARGCDKDLKINLEKKPNSRYSVDCERLRVYILSRIQAYGALNYAGAVFRFPCLTPEQRFKKLELAKDCLDYFNTNPENIDPAELRDFRSRAWKVESGRLFGDASEMIAGGKLGRLIHEFSLTYDNSYKTLYNNTKEDNGVQNHLMDPRNVP